MQAKLLVAKFFGKSIWAVACLVAQGLVACAPGETSLRGDSLTRRLNLGDGVGLPDPATDSTVITSPSPSPEVSVTQPCQEDKVNTFLTKEGFLEHANPDQKPGTFGTDTAVTGVSWANGGTNKSRESAPVSTLDFRLCTKIAFNERGHSLTRLIKFIDPSADGEYQLVIHRVRYPKESKGIGIWYHWDERVTWKDNKSLHKFNEHKDYRVTCQFKAADDKPWSCSYAEETQSAIDCSKYARRGVECRKIELPGT